MNFVPDRAGVLDLAKTGRLAFVYRKALAHTNTPEIAAADVSTDVVISPGPCEATRYHSLLIERSTVPDSLDVTAQTEEGEIMAVRHKTLPVEGVPFHPESFLSTVGKDLLRNFIERGGRS